MQLVAIVKKALTLRGTIATGLQAVKPCFSLKFGYPVPLANQLTSLFRRDPSAATVELSPEPNASMQEYYQLCQALLTWTLAFTAIVFVTVWITYSLNLALNYLIGACTGVVYLRMLARDVEQLGRSRKRLGSTRLALVAGLIIVATQWNQLQVMPVFLGFLTYKVALIVYVIWSTYLTDTRPKPDPSSGES